MILQHVRSFSSLLLFVAACSPTGGQETADDTGSGADTGPGIVTTTPTTSGSAASSSGGDVGEEDTATAGDSSSGGGPPCVSDEDCEPMYICTSNRCEYDVEKCGGLEIAEIIAPQVVLVLDKSGSMVLNSWDHDADPASAAITRWKSLHGVVELVVDGFDKQMELGAVLFPGTNAKANLNEACLMNDAPDVAVGPMHGASILAALPLADADSATVQGGTPATAGVELAVGHLKGLAAGPKRYLVLVTDGAANCKADPASAYEIGDVYDVALAPTVAAAYAEHGVATFVVGVDIQDVTTPVKADGQPDATNTYERLNEVAIAGGVPRAGEEKFYNAMNQIELAAALTAIAQQVSCSIDLVPKPTKYQEVVVEIGGVEVMEVESCDAGVGWRFLDPIARDSIELCAAACAAYQAVAAQPKGIVITYRCQTPG